VFLAAGLVESLTGSALDVGLALPVGARSGVDVGDHDARHSGGERR
jgi:hypothetical protein